MRKETAAGRVLALGEIGNQYLGINYWAAVEGVESAKFLTPKEERDIFYNNAVEFFRLNNKPRP